MRTFLALSLMGLIAGCGGETTDSLSETSGGGDGGGGGSVASSTTPSASATGGGGAGGSGVGGAGAGGAGVGGSGGAGEGGSSSSSSSGGGGGGEPACPVGVTCVDTFPFHDERNTASEGSSVFNTYSCASGTNEGGREILYRVKLPADGFLSAAVYDGAGVDVDVHLLQDRDASTCLDRGDLHARADVSAGYAWVVADTFVSGGAAQSGAFAIDIGFIVPSEGPCALETGVMARVNDGGSSLPMPATGKMVKEAHLVTDEEPAPYPMTSTEELQAHYALSQAKTGLVMYRKEVWAPLEGGSHYGAGIFSPNSFPPVVDEGWYVNMYWRSTSRPAKGTRMIVIDPADPTRAVVVSAGYETGPGDLSFVGGTPEETHFYMHTTHGSSMKLGIAADSTLPLGPRRCTP